jgi:hypothetical protein
VRCCATALYHRYDMHWFRTVFLGLDATYNAPVSYFRIL